jgi:glycosyltransferase involved in cell wall biosynthesis
MPLVTNKVAKQVGCPISHKVLDTEDPDVRILSALSGPMKSDAIIVNIAERFLYKLCALRYLLPKQFPLLISVDIHLEPPARPINRVISFLKAFLLKQVDYFILYFKDVSGYRRYYGVDPEKCIYVPFKVNQLELIRSVLSEYGQRGDPSDGDSIMAIGRSCRDIDTFARALSKTGLPAKVLTQDRSVMQSYGTVLREKTFPPNVEPVEHDGNQRSFVQHIAGARIIVIPRFRWDIKSTGISNYLMAMALGKCVIITHGPGTTELLGGGKAILVPPEDPDTLAKNIQMVWDNPQIRRDIASKGQKYAFSLGGEDRLLEEILTKTYKLFRESAVM